jgi:hypothetical protein
MMCVKEQRVGAATQQGGSEGMCKNVVKLFTFLFRQESCHLLRCVHYREHPFCLARHQEMEFLNLGR